MRNELHLARRLRRLALAIGLTLTSAAGFAQAQDAPPPASGVSYPAPATDAGQGAPDGVAPAPAPERGGRHSRGEIRPYLEVQQVLSADLSNGGDTLTYTSVAAGVDGHVETRRVTAQASLRYERDIDWNGHVQQQDNVSGLAMVHAEVAPGAVSLDAGALATRTGGPGRVFGVTNRDDTVDVYSVYAGPTLAAHAGPLAINGAYRFGYTKVDDHGVAPLLGDEFDSSTEHSLTGSIGMGTRDTGLPFGWTVGAGYVRDTSNDAFRHRFEGSYVRGDVVVPVGPTLALTAGVGYERIRASQRDFVRDAGGAPVLNAAGQPQADPNRRQLTYDVDGVMYDGGIIWRPSPRTELQARAGHRYGGTTYLGTLAHRFGSHSSLNIAVYDTVETFGHQLTNDISSLPANFNAGRDPLTGSLGGCVFGAAGGATCLDRSLTAITGDTFRARGVMASLAGGRGLWSYGIGASYNNRHYFRPVLTGVTVLGATRDEDFSVYGNLGRQLSRTSSINFDAYASWYDNNLANFDAVTTEGATFSYSRSFMLEHLQFMAALGLYHSGDGTISSTNGAASAGLRYTF